MVKKQRIWEIDFLRGFLILFVIFDHFMWDVNELGGSFSSSFGKKLYEWSVSYYTTGANATVFGGLREITRYSFVMLFVAISGVSSRFSKNNFVRGMLLAGAGIGFTLITVLLPLIGIEGVYPIRFNVIHVLAICTLAFSGLEQIYSKRLTSRLMGNYTVLPFVGRDLRDIISSSIFMTAICWAGCSFSRRTSWKQEYPRGIISLCFLLSAGFCWGRGSAWCCIGKRKRCFPPSIPNTFRPSPLSAGIRFGFISDLRLSCTA